VNHLSKGNPVNIEVVVKILSTLEKSDEGEEPFGVGLTLVIKVYKEKAICVVYPAVHGESILRGVIRSSEKLVNIGSVIGVVVVHGVFVVEHFLMMLGGLTVGCFALCGMRDQRPIPFMHWSQLQSASLVMKWRPQMMLSISVVRR